MASPFWRPAAAPGGEKQPPRRRRRARARRGARAWCRTGPRRRAPHAATVAAPAGHGLVLGVVTWPAGHLQLEWAPRARRVPPARRRAAHAGRRTGPRRRAPHATTVAAPAGRGLVLAHHSGRLWPAKHLQLEWAPRARPPARRRAASAKGWRVSPCELAFIAASWPNLASSVTGGRRRRWRPYYHRTAAA
jgi:hypothetical protein